MPNVPKRGFDEQALAILEIIENHGGTYKVGDPGEVLGNLAREAGITYFATSALVLAMEKEGWVEVLRWSHDEPRRANRIVSITLI